MSNLDNKKKNVLEFKIKLKVPFLFIQKYSQYTF